MIKIKDVIEFENATYTVVSTTEYNELKYAYIINIDNYNDVKFISIKKNEAEVVTDKDVIKEIIKLFNIEINEKKLSDLC